MEWRVGHKVPINVYEGDRPVCQCHNVEDALAIVAAMNQVRAMTMDPVSNYRLQCTQAEAMVQSYYNGGAPFAANSACIPAIPCDAEGDPLVAAEDIPFHFIELAQPDGSNRLAILTPYEVANGPGQVFRVRPER